MFFFQLPRLPEWIIRRNNFNSLSRVFKDDVVTTGSFTDDDIEMYKEALGQKGALTSAINYYRANAFRLIRGAKAKTSQDSGPVRSGRVKVPTLFIFGEQDAAILPQTVLGVAKYIDGPYSELRIPGSGHWVQNEAVEEVNSALIEFLRMR
jgi:pimeloyl-ACP methyl ester carboxylesterase